MSDSRRSKLMIASFLTLVASGVGFATRAACGTIWGTEFNIPGSDFGMIMGAGFLGFGIMIFFGGILVEQFGYKKLLMLAFLLHLISAAMLLFASPMFDTWKQADASTATLKVTNLLYWSVFLFSIAQGLYEAVINPMIADLYPDSKTHHLNILHAGWPAGMIVGGLIAASFMGPDAWITTLDWQIPLCSFAVFVLIYGVLAFTEVFPETVAQSNVGWGVLFSCFASPVFLLLLLLHGCIGYVELGVDSWMTKLMENLLKNSVIVLVYTSGLMFLLRFFAGPIVHKINPIGLLFVSSIIGCLGLLWLGSDIQSVGMIFAAATVYSLGKAFWWPTMLGVAGERFPQSGAVAMGALGAVGMLTVGLVAGKAIGYKQDMNAAAYLQQESPSTLDRYATKGEKSVLGLPTYRNLIGERVGAATKAEQVDGAWKLDSFNSMVPPEIPPQNDGETAEQYQTRIEDLLTPGIKENLIVNAPTDVPLVKKAQIYGGRRALTLTAIVPGIMAVGFLILLIYFSMTGGYRKVELKERVDVSP